MDKPIVYLAFNVLFWTGLREGELLALEAGDFDRRVERSGLGKQDYILRKLCDREVVVARRCRKAPAPLACMAGGAFRAARIVGPPFPSPDAAGAPPAAAPLSWPAAEPSATLSPSTPPT